MKYDLKIEKSLTTSEWKSSSVQEVKKNRESMKNL